MNKLLFVCTGNTCRSPMAEGFFNSMAASLGVCWRAESCGIYAEPGAPASTNAVCAMKEFGADISAHRTRRADEAAIREADKIICVTKRHLKLLSEAFPEYKEKMDALKTDIPDPYGGDLEVYRQAAAAIGRAVSELIKELKDGV